MEKHRFRASAISQKRISCETSFKSPSATHPTASLAIPFYIAGTILELQITMEFHRQFIHQHRSQPHLQCGNDPTVVNHNGILWTTRGRKTVETPMIRPCSDHDPTTHETVSHPSHRRGRSSRFGDALCMEKHRVSCICYLSKTHFVRDFFKTPSATHPPAPLAIPFTLRERS